MKCDVKESNASQFYGKIIGGGDLPYLTYIRQKYSRGRGIHFCLKV